MQLSVSAGASPFASHPIGFTSILKQLLLIWVFRLLLSLWCWRWCIMCANQLLTTYEWTLAFSLTVNDKGCSHQQPNKPS